MFENGNEMVHMDVILDNVSATWLCLKSKMTQKSTIEIIGDLIRGKIEMMILP